MAIPNIPENSGNEKCKIIKAPKKIPIFYDYKILNFYPMNFFSDVIEVCVILL